MSIGQPSIYEPTRLVGPRILGSLACIYGPTTGGTIIKGLSILNYNTTVQGFSLFLGPSGFTGAATNAIVQGVPAPTDGMPVKVVPDVVPEINMAPTDVLHGLSSLHTGAVMYAWGIEMK